MTRILNGMFLIEIIFFNKMKYFSIYLNTVLIIIITIIIIIIIIIITFADSQFIGYDF